MTHDVIHHVLNASPIVGQAFKERVGCIEVMDNSFVGNGAIIMYGVRIAQNCIIAAGSVVTKDTEPNSVYAGVPARKIGTFVGAADKRLLDERSGKIVTIERNQELSAQEIESAWHSFEECHR